VNVLSYGTLTLNLRTRFVDWDMFIRYTDLGVGHPLMSRRIIRDFDPVILTNAMDIVNEDDRDHEEVGDGNSHEECDDRQDEGDDEFGDEELEDEDERDKENENTFDDFLSF
jgi:hypothetical protein